MKKTDKSRLQIALLSPKTLRYVSEYGKSVAIRLEAQEALLAHEDTSPGDLQHVAAYSMTEVIKDNAYKALLAHKDTSPGGLCYVAKYSNSEEIMRRAKMHSLSTRTPVLVTFAASRSTPLLMRSG